MEVQHSVMRLLRPLLLVTAVLLSALPAVAQSDDDGDDHACSAEYSGEQCLQMQNGGDTQPPGSGDGCPFNLCGNASPSAISSVGWCEATESWEDCPIAYCSYSPCIGTNCTPTFIVCSACSSRQGNNADMTNCPRI